MFSVLGILIVFGVIVGGFLMEIGSLMVLVQPAELVIIGGAAVGTVLVGGPLPPSTNRNSGVTWRQEESPHSGKTFRATDGHGFTRIREEKTWFYKDGFVYRCESVSIRGQISCSKTVTQRPSRWQCLTSPPGRPFRSRFSGA